MNLSSRMAVIIGVVALLVVAIVRSAQVNEIATDDYETVKSIISKEKFDELLPVHRRNLLALVRSRIRGQHPRLAACWVGSAGDQEAIDAFNAALQMGVSPGAEFQQASRWTSTATPGNGNSQGEPTVLTYSFVPDGTALPSGQGEPAAPSTLFAWMNGLYTTPAVWKQIFHDEFARWSALTGITYVFQPTDDGAALPTFGGILGVRGDVRIGAHPIDGNSNTVAYNYFPNGGDMVLDMGDSYFSSMGTNSRRLRNTIAHEAGHGLGMDHVCPDDGTKVMEPFIITGFLGAQHDDILNGQRHYGDPNEPNNNAATATDLGPLTLGTTTVDTVSTDDNSDFDYYKFTTNEPLSLSLTLRPAGLTYLEGPQTMACNAGTNFDSTSVSDLALSLIGTNGTTFLQIANATGVGGNEEIIDYSLGTPGTYYIRVNAGSTNNIQNYELDLKFDWFPVYTFNGALTGDNFGLTVDSVGDVNGDGFDDVIIGANQADTANGVDSGSAKVISGFDQSVLYSFIGDSPSELLGHGAAGAGDVNADGFDDFIIGAWRADFNGVDSGRARVYSGVDGSVLHTFDGAGPNARLGLWVDGANDVNADGFDDVILGATSTTTANGAGSGAAWVYSGLDGSLLYMFIGDNANDGFGRGRGIGDANGDGFADLAVAATTDDNNGAGSGSVRVFSGIDGSVLYTVNGDSAGDSLGSSLQATGDVDCDGFDDFVAGARLDDDNGTDAGSARVYSGIDGSVLFHFDGDGPGDRFGISSDGAGDFNGDGFADVIVGGLLNDTNGADAGMARLFSGRDGSVLHTFYGEAAGDELGTVSSAGDINSDGFGDIVIGSKSSDVVAINAGNVKIYAAPPRPVLSYQSDIADPRLKLFWTPDGGDVNSVTGKIACVFATPGGTGFVGISFAPANILIAGFLPLFVANDPVNLIDTPSIGYGFFGEAIVTGVSRQNPFIAGSFVYLQFFELNPIISSSNGLRLLMVP